MSSENCSERQRKSAEKYLKTYAGGRFRTVNEAAANLMYNLGIGLEIKQLGFRERIFLEVAYGARWYKMLT